MSLPRISDPKIMTRFCSPRSWLRRAIHASLLVVALASASAAASSPERKLATALSAPGAIWAKLVVQSPPPLALDLDLPLGFEGELIFQASIDSVADLDAAGHTVALHAARVIHDVAPKVIAEPARWICACQGVSLTHP